MAKKSKLLTALDAYKGRDYEAEKRQKQVKAAEKRKRQKSENAKEDEEPEQDGDSVVSADQNGDASLLDQGEKEEFASFSDDEEDEPNGTSTSTTIPQPDVPIDASASEAENESDVPLSDLEDEDLEDTIPHQRLTINNGPALLASCKRISLIKNPKSTPFHAHNSLISSLPTTETSIPDPNDDLTRELEFYRIARDAAVEARALLKKEKVPFSRPADYFAEMVKSDEHMGRVKKKMYDEAASKKAGEEARKLRDAKKFGKAVQVAKEQERAKEKRNTLDKIKEMKRKRKGQDTGKVREDGDDELFQSVDVDKAPAKDRSGRERGAGEGPNTKRQKRDHKYGFGGKKRHSKSGDAMSSGDLAGFSASKMKGKAKQRPGKSRRAAGR